MTLLRSRLRIAAPLLAASAALVTSLGPIGCGDESGTTGARIALEVAITASADARQFDNAQGWRVSVTKALVSTGAFYFYDGETLFARGGARPARGGWSLVKPAFAHPGHYVPGDARGEMLTPSSADLLAGGVLGVGSGVTGFARSATFAFGAPPAGPLAAALGESAVVLEGTARKGDATRSFRVAVAPSELADAKGAPQIEGCPFVPADMQGDGVVTITVKIPLWFDHVAFDDVPEGADGQPVTLEEGLARNQLVRGMKAGLGYVFSYAPR